MRLSIRTSRRRRLFESDTHRHTHRERIRDKYSRRDTKEKKTEFITFETMLYPTCFFHFAPERRRAS